MRDIHEQRTRSAGLSRRSALRIFLGGVGVTLLAACGPSAAPPSATTPPAPPTAAAAGQAAPTTAGAPTLVSVAAAKPTVAAAPKSGGTLRSGIVGDLNGLEPHILVGTTFESSWLVFDRLTSYDDKLVPQPQLAESWDISPDATQFKLNLRKGVQFHTGREFTSDDVKYNMIRVRDPKTGAGQFAIQSNWFPTIETPDKYTVILKSDSPRPLTFDFFELFNMTDKDTTEGPEGKTRAVGTGPFSFVEWVQGDHFTVVRNPNYWQSGRPYLDGVRVMSHRDPQAAIAQFEGGAIDYIKAPSLSEFARLKGDSRFQGLVHPNAGRFFVYGLNTLKAPMDNKKVRQAVNYAIDRKRFVDTITLGLGKVQALPWLPGSPAYEPAKEAAYGYDLDKARALLKEAGVGDFEMGLVMTSTLEGNAMAQIWQADLAKIGVKLNISVLDNAAWNDQVNNRKYTGAYYGSASKANLQPGTNFTASTLFMPLVNNSGFKNDHYTELVNQVAAEPDPARQKQLYSELNDIFLDESFTITLSPDTVIGLARNTVRGVTPKAYGSFGLTDTWLDAS